MIPLSALPAPLTGGAHSKAPPLVSAKNLRLTRSQYHSACRRSRQSLRVQKMAYDVLVERRPLPEVAEKYNIEPYSVVTAIHAFHERAVTARPTIAAAIYVKAVENWSIPDVFKTAVRMYLVDGFSAHWIADRLNITAQQIHNRVKIARQRLTSYAATGTATKDMRTHGRPRSDLPRLLKTELQLNHFQLNRSGRSCSWASMQIIHNYHVANLPLRECIALAKKRHADVYAILQAFERAWSAYCVRHDVKIKPTPKVGNE